MPIPLPREERRKINEPCLWCFAESERSLNGVILNESGSGILLETNERLDIGKRIWVLSLPGDDPTTLTISPEDLINHPLSRAGAVVRQENGKRVGVQFDREEKERPQYQRWYRGKSAVVTLIDGDRATVALSGGLNFESSVLLERLFTKQIKPFREILFACHEVDQVNNTALTVLRTALRNCDKSGVQLTIITGGESAESLEKSLTLEHGAILNIGGVGAPAPTASGAAETSAPSSAKTASTPTTPEGVVILTRGTVGLNRLAMPLARLDIPTWKTQNFKEGTDLIAAYNPRFVVIDVELEHCPLLVEINRIRKMTLPRIPPAIVIGPPHLGELIREALALPVKFYLTKPCTDREYTTGLQNMLREKYNGK